MSDSSAGRPCALPRPKPYAPPVTSGPKRLPFNRRVFEERAARFEELDVTTLTPDELYDELMWVVSTTVTRRGPIHAQLPMQTRLLPKGTLLWRARALAPDDHVLPLKGMNSEGDAWEPPARFITVSGRLNKPGEPLLYTCVAQPLAAPREIRVQGAARPPSDCGVIKARSRGD